MFIPLHDDNALKHVSLHYVTLGLIVANIFVFLVEMAQTGRAADLFIFSYGLVPDWLDGDRPGFLAAVPEPLTLVTYAFLHGDFWHILGNMLFLWVFGDNVEDALGHVRFLAFYLLCAIGAAALHAFTHPESQVPLVGASGAIAGVVAGYLMLHPRVRVWVLLLGKIPLRLNAAWLLGAWILLQLWHVAANDQDTVAWWAHVGGLVTGAVLVVLLRRPGVPLFDRGLGRA